MEGFQERHEDAYDVSRQSVFSSTTCHILLAEFEELLIELHAFKLTVGFQQRLATWKVTTHKTNQGQPTEPT